MALTEYEEDDQVWTETFEYLEWLDQIDQCVMYAVSDIKKSKCIIFKGLCRGWGKPV